MLRHVCMQICTKTCLHMILYSAAEDKIKIKKLAGQHNVYLTKLTHCRIALANTWVLDKCNLTQKQVDESSVTIIYKRTHHRKHRPQIKLRRGDCDSRSQIKLSAIWALLHTLLQQLAQKEIEEGAASNLGCSTN